MFAEQLINKFGKHSQTMICTNSSERNREISASTSFNTTKISNFPLRVFRSTLKILISFRNPKWALLSCFWNLTKTTRSRVETEHKMLRILIMFNEIDWIWSKMLHPALTYLFDEWVRAGSSNFDQDQPTSSKRSIEKRINYGRLQWAGHVVRMSKERIITKTIFSMEPGNGRWLHGRLRTCWLHVVEKDLRITKCSGKQEQQRPRPTKIVLYYVLKAGVKLLYS